MARKKKAPPSGPSQAYLISFGDTMTALLAFFIVLNSMAEEQTGANLYSGTGSFVSSMGSFGLPGKIEDKSSKYVFQKTNVSPLYIVNDGEAKPGKGEGPDKQGNALRVINRERDQLRRFLIEMENFGKTGKLPQTTGMVVLDIFEEINKTSPMISQNATDTFRNAITRAARGNCKIDIVVWARTPSVTSWKKATNQANAIREDLFARLGVPSRLRTAVTAQGKPWFYSDERRPRYSFAIRKLEK